MSGPFTLVSLHAHPDDEALLTGGTLARAAAEGHRVVLVVATAGEAGLSQAGPAGAEAGLGARRRRELEASARALGVARVVVLGHPDSGWTHARPAGSGPAFADLDPEVVGAEVAALLREEDADVLTTYDAAGGYGHPDHVQVHRVGAVAARLAGTPVLLEATADRRLFDRALRVLRAASRVLPVPTLPEPGGLFTDPADLTHRVDVRAHWAAKRAALLAHRSQAGGGVRTLDLLARVPLPVLRRVWGVEWFRRPGAVRPPGAPYADDVFATLRQHPGEGSGGPGQRRA